MSFILASASPRRKVLLAELITDFLIEPSDLDEILDPKLTPVQQVESLALQKAMDIAKKHSTEATWVLGSDTIVSLGERLLGKPESEGQAFEMLSSLSGQWHEVITGVAVVQTPALSSGLAHCVSRVKMRAITADEIQAYIATGEPMDKAGAYAIQGGAKAFIEKVEGAYDNIVGLPVETVKALLTQQKYFI